MWRKLEKGIFKERKKRLLFALLGLCSIACLLAACSGASTATSNGGASVAEPPQSHDASGSAASQPGGSASGQKPAGGNNASQYGPQYLEKTLQVSMEVPDTSQSATDLQQWFAGSDPQATSDGMNYEQTGPDQYSVTLTFLVDITHYAQVENYLRSYAGQKGHTLVSLQENVQDVTNDFVDTQASLTNLRAEAQRLVTLMNQAQSLSDTLNIEQQLTQVDGQINDIEAHLNDLKGATTFYTVTVMLQPSGTITPPPPPARTTWSVVPVWQGAWSAVVGIWQVLVTIIVWLAALSVYIIPAAIVAWLIRKRIWRGLPRIVPAGSMNGVNGPEPK